MLLVPITHETKSSKLISFTIFCEVNLNKCVKMEKAPVPLLRHTGPSPPTTWSPGAAALPAPEALALLNSTSFCQQKKTKQTNK